MGNTIGSMERRSAMQNMGLHGLVALPPSDLNFFATVQSGSTFAVVGYSWTLAEQSCGVPVSVTFHIVSSTGWAAGDSVTFLVTGYNELYELVSESVTLTNPATDVKTNGLFSRVTSVVTTAVEQTISTETLTIGIGDESAETFYVLKPSADLDYTQFRFRDTAAPGTIYTPTANSPGGQGVALNYAADAACKVCAVEYLVDFRTLMGM